jgi:dihydroorotate dehydrogenase
MPKKIKENEAGTVGLNPNMNVQSMGNATLPGNPGSMNSFGSQKTGSGDLLEPIKKRKKKKKRLLSFDKFLNIVKGR